MLYQIANIISHLFSATPRRMECATRAEGTFDETRHDGRHHDGREAKQPACAHGKDRCGIHDEGQALQPEEPGSVQGKFNASRDRVSPG